MFWEINYAEVPGRLMRYDIFCKVVDNFGDAAVCWRLARQLALEHDCQVRLWLDQLEVLAMLRPDLDRTLQCQTLDGVEIQSWRPEATVNDPGDVVVEGFGCGLPEALGQAMARRTPQSLWIVLEYLSAEEWVGRYHGLPSPHPRLSLQRFFFYPGFTRATGGLLRESALTERSEAFQASPEARAAFWNNAGFAPPPPLAQTLSLFAYDNDNIDALLAACAAGSEQTVVAVAPGRLRQQVCRFFGDAEHGDGASLRRGKLEARLMPFLPQPRYDELLWACDWNFVRGEDSFVRSQWTAAPFVWQIYPQKEDAHMVKLEAFLALYLAGLDADAATAWAGFWRSWNGSGQDLGEHWNALQNLSGKLLKHARLWQQRLAEMPDLTTNLANFCSERLKSRV